MLGITALTSFAAGTATLSIFFVTERPPFSFTAVQQYALGLLVGLSYMAGALLAGDARRLLALRGITACAMLGWLSLALAALMLVPIVFRSDTSIFVLLGLYSPLTGFFWPLIEGYVSGGRREAELRLAMGRFNLVWSATLLLSFLLPPFLAEAPDQVFLAVALAHLATPLFLARLQAEPGLHALESHEVPAGYRELLRVHRVLHATSYLVMYALSPYLPALLGRMGVDRRLHGLIAATWLAARTLTFALLGRFGGWHGRWLVATLGSLLVLGGFAAALLAPNLGVAALPCLIAALVAFGTGLAALYTAALYYAFEVGGNDGGSSHEALVGLGYSVGPSCGLFACALESGGWIAPSHRDGLLLLTITTLCLAGALLAWRFRRPARARPDSR